MYYPSPNPRNIAIEKLLPTISLDNVGYEFSLSLSLYSFIQSEIVPSSDECHLYEKSQVILQRDT